MFSAPGKSLRKNGVLQKLVMLARLTMENAPLKVRIGNKVGQAFQVKSGVRQLDALSAILLNLALQEWNHCRQLWAIMQQIYTTLS